MMIVLAAQFHMLQQLKNYEKLYITHVMQRGKIRLMKSNPTKVWLFILLTSITFIVIGHQFAGRMGLFLGLVFSLTMNFFLFFYGENRLLEQLGAQRWKGQDPWGLSQILTDVCRQLSIKRPMLCVFENNTVTAFSLSLPWGRSSVAFSTGLLKKLSPEEVQTILIHQISHIQRLDSFLFGVSSLLANSIVGIGDFLDRFWIPNFFFQKKQAFFRSILSPIGWIIIKSVIRNKTYYENDLVAADLIKDRRRLAEVLWRLESLTENNPQLVPACTSHLFIVNPEGLLRKNIFLKSHPPTADRIKRLIGYYPI